MKHISPRDLDDEKMKLVVLDLFTSILWFVAAGVNLLGLLISSSQRNWVLAPLQLAGCLFSVYALLRRLR